MAETKIKTALEMAMERLGKRKEVNPEEVLRLEAVPKGRVLGAKFLNDKNFALLDVLNEEDKNISKYILEGIQEVFLANLLLPVTDEMLMSNQKVMEGLAIIKNNKKQIAGILKDMGAMFSHYRQTLDQATESFKQQVQMHQENQARMQGPDAPQVDYQQEWAMLLNQINQRYENAFAEMKESIKNLT